VFTEGSDAGWFSEHSGKRRDLLRLRAAVLRAVRNFFEARDYLEVQTPIAVPSPGTEVHLDAFEIGEGSSAQFLITSPEYHMKRLLSGGLERVFQVTTCFRRHERGSLHEPEFTMLEWYQAHGTYASLMQETEELVTFVCRQVLGRTWIDVEGSRIDLAAPWQRMSVCDAFQAHADADALQLAEREETFFRVLVDQVEPHLGRDKPCFLYDYPARMAALARLKPSNVALAERFEAYVAGIELCNGYVELTDSEEQRQRCLHDLQRRRAINKPLYPLDERFLAALEHGIPPCIGNALGFDRLVMLLAGADNIQDVMAFSDARR